MEINKYALLADVADITPNIHFSSKDDHAIVSMVANNLGVSILPKLVIEGVQDQIMALPLEPFYSKLTDHFT